MFKKKIKNRYKIIDMPNHPQHIREKFLGQFRDNQMLGSIMIEYDKNGKRKRVIKVEQKDIVLKEYE